MKYTDYTATGLKIKKTNLLLFHLEQIDLLLKEKLRFVGMVRLLNELFAGHEVYGESKTWEDSLFEAIDTLTDREKTYITMRYGLKDGRSLTYEEIGQQFGLTKERARQVVMKAIRKLKHPSRKRMLLGATWQEAVQEAKAMGQKLLLEHSQERRKGMISQLTKDRKDIESITPDIAQLNLPTRIHNALYRVGYHTIHHLEIENDNELFKCRNIGTKSLKYIREAIKRFREKELKEK